MRAGLYMKKIIIMLLCACLLVPLPLGCTVEAETPVSEAGRPQGSPSEPVNDSGGNTANEPVVVDDPGNAAPMPSENLQPDPTPAESRQPDPVPAIVFDAMIDDPFVARMNSPGIYAEGKAVLKLTLYETAPGIYSGDGTLDRTISMGGTQGAAQNSSETYYRLSFQDLRPGMSGESTLAAFLVYDSSTLYGGVDEGLGVWNIHVRTNQLTPVGYCLDVWEGGTARLFLNIGFEFEFTGSITQAPPVQQNLDHISGRGVSVNSVFYETGRSYNHEYRAMLTAMPASGFEYSGDLCVYGTANEMPFVDETVRFTLQPFDVQAYHNAGGALPGSFDAFGVIRASDGDYILLIDGDRPLIEPANSDMIFYGSLIAGGEADMARHEADETKRLMRTLYDGPDPTKADMGSIPGHWTGKPPWYPDWLMPVPINSSQWLWVEQMNMLSFNRYRAHYRDGARIDEVFEDYSSQLSDNEGFRAYDPGRGDAAIYFTKGAYSIMIQIEALNALESEVVVWIT